ncbi:MAG TPA: arylesterase [Acidobacteriota bacterium]|nr:arylesterase [Acidobacteriota bacterium]
MRKCIVLIFLGAAMATGCGKSRTDPPRSAGSTREAFHDIAVPSDSRPLIVALGDSLTAGLGVEQSQNYPSKLQAEIAAAGYHYRVVNAGVSGDTTAQGLNRLDSVRSLHPKIVILELGGNDGLRGLPLTETRSNLESIIGPLQRDGTTVVLAGMEMPPNYGVAYTTEFRQIFRDLAKKYHTPLIPFFLAGVGGRPELNQDDGIHPTAQGYDIVVRNVWTVLKAELR